MKFRLAWKTQATQKGTAMRRETNKIMPDQNVCARAYDLGFSRYQNAPLQRRPLPGFTLIELLVVIAIIALLLSILVPGLAKVKEMASMINCLSDLKNLTIPFIGYADDNKGKFCRGDVPRDTTTRNPPSWVKPPLAYAGSTQTYMGDGDPALPSTPKTLDHELNGLREGALYPYLKDTKVFHCPGDKRIRKGKSYPYRSYGIPDFYAAIDSTDETLLANVKAGGTKLLMVEDQYDNATYNVDGWSFVPSSDSLWDPLGNYHNKSCTFSFVDGHAENHKWQDERTMIFCSDRNLASMRGFGKGQQQLNPTNPDIRWLDQVYPWKTRLKKGN
jgi:prepilin-type N-terminal cleavage/methylation domain-containing protein/prepilin-type processing-associated H-X9-DG protein